MPKVIHFEMETKNPEQKIVFYEGVFGWTFKKFMEDYWLITTGEKDEKGIDGALMLGTEDKLKTVNTIEVKSLVETLAKIEAQGGKVVSEKMDIPDVGVFAYCQDPEGLPLGVIQMK